MIRLPLFTGGIPSIVSLGDFFLLQITQHYPTRMGDEGDGNT